MLFFYVPIARDCVVDHEEWEVSVSDWNRELEGIEPRESVGFEVTSERGSSVFSA